MNGNPNHGHKKLKIFSCSPLFMGSIDFQLIFFRINIKEISSSFLLTEYGNFEFTFGFGGNFSLGEDSDFNID